METKIDLHILTLKKLTLSCMLDEGIQVYNKDGEKKKMNFSSERYISAHYFDYLEFLYVEDASSNFMQSAYKSIEAIRTNNSEETKIQQSIILFQYLYSSNDVKASEEFWRNNASHIFVTMIKLAGSNSVQKLNEAREKIIHVLKENNIQPINYALYFTFDFSDLILLTKNLNNSVLQDILWQINYNVYYDEQPDKNKIVRDTITLYGINQECFDAITKKHNLTDEKLRNLMSNYLNAVFSLGVQDPSLLKNIGSFLKNELLLEDKVNYNINALFGRRDISIELRGVRAIDVIKLYCELKKISYDCNDSARCFLGMKIISSVSESDLIKNIVCIDSSSSENESLSNVLVDNLTTQIKDLVDRYNQLPHTHYMDVQEMYHSIKELSKNCFSDEFLISIYHSFYVFLKICIYQTKKSNQSYMEIIDFQREYVSCINMLSHCTMHGEKCFIQAAPFNPLLVDVPPKILAFYTALALRIQKKLQQDEAQLFSFLFVPGFKSGIHMKPISCGTAEDSRLIAVFIHEEMLYDPYRVVCSMIHEVAHFVGNKTRCRGKRFCNIAITTLKFFMYTCYPKNGAFDLAESLFKVMQAEIKNMIGEQESEELYLSLISDYFIDYTNLISLISNVNECPADFNIIRNLDEYLDTDNYYYPLLHNLMENPNINGAICSKIIFKSMTDEIRNFSKNDWYLDYSNQIDQIIGSYREAYADLIFCTLTSISKEQYIQLISKEISLSNQLNSKEITSDYLYTMNQRGVLNLETTLRMNAILCVVFRITPTFNICSDDIERVVYKIMLENLIDYLKECQNVIEQLNIVNDEFSNLVKELYDLNDKAFNLIYDEISKYKNLVVEIIKKQEEPK